MDVNLPNKNCHGATLMENNVFPNNIFRKNNRKKKKQQQKVLIPTKSSTTVMGEMICGFLIL